MKVTQQYVTDHTEELVFKSQSETIYIIDDVSGLVINKLQNGQILPVTPDEVVKNS